MMLCSFPLSGAPWVLLLQREKGTEESEPGLSRLQIRNSECCQNCIENFGQNFCCNVVVIWLHQADGKNLEEVDL